LYKWPSPVIKNHYLPAYPYPILGRHQVIRSLGVGPFWALVIHTNLCVRKSGNEWGRKPSATDDASPPNKSKAYHLLSAAQVAVAECSKTRRADIGHWGHLQSGDPQRELPGDQNRNY
jgi:hypothetical protein